MPALPLRMGVIARISRPMSNAVSRKLKSWEKSLRTSFGDSIATPAARRNALWHYHIFDHAFLRKVWTNFYQIAPGVYRSNQPTHGRFEAMQAQQRAFMKAMTGGMTPWSGSTSPENEKGDDLDDIKKQLAELQAKLSKMS